jgi:hypothetical protein
MVTTERNAHELRAFGQILLSGWLRLHRDFVDETPQPALARLEGLHDRMLGGPKMLRGVLVLGRVAAAHVAALAAQAKVNPGISRLEALLTTLGEGAHILDVTHVRTAFAHDGASCSCFGWLLE